jgi:hypothetical protein
LDDAKKAVDLSEHALAFIRLEFQPGEVRDPGNILWGQRHGSKTLLVGCISVHWAGLGQRNDGGIGYYPVFAEGLRMPCQAPILIHPI